MAAGEPAGTTAACAAVVHLTAPRHCLGARLTAVVVPDPRPARLVATHLHAAAGDLIQAPRLSGETRLGSAVLTADDPAALAAGVARVRAQTAVSCSRDA